MIKNIWKILFFVYVLLLLNFIVIKFNGDIREVINTISSNIERREVDSQSGINLIPFKTISSYIEDTYYSVPILNILGNIIPFIPMGFLIPMAFPSLRNIAKTLILCLFIVCSIEVLQFVTFLGSFDIDDIILNILSSFIGYILFVVYRKFFNIVS